MKKNLDFHL